MQDNNSKIQELTDTVTKLRADLDNLNSNFYKNNFSSSQSFNKDVAFNGRLKVPSHASAPSVGEIGDLIEISGTLYICTTAGTVASPATFTVVGTQV